MLHVLSRIDVMSNVKESRYLLYSLYDSDRGMIYFAQKVKAGSTQANNTRQGPDHSYSTKMSTRPIFKIDTNLNQSSQIKANQRR